MRKGIPIALGFVFLLTLASPALADSKANNLSLSLSGGVVSAGNQAYSISGGHLVSALVPGYVLDHSSAKIAYSVSAVVEGLDVSGSAMFNISASFADGSHLYVHGVASIIDVVPGAYFPLGCTLGVDCASQIPSGFVAVADVTETLCHGAIAANKCTSTELSEVPMVFESSYLNPFGGPIFFGSADGSIAVISTYTASKVTWTGIQLGGSLSGALAGSPVTGSFGMTVNAVEDMLAGSEQDHGTISFLTDNAAVTASGSFSGHSVIPAGGTPCPPLGFPAGTCLVTGFTSSGAFSQTNSLGGSIAGRYSTLWTAPAVLFGSSVSATVK